MSAVSRSPRTIAKGKRWVEKAHDREIYRVTIGRLSVRGVQDFVLPSCRSANLSNPARNEVVSLNVADGALRWQSVVAFPEGKFSWGPGTVVTGGNRQRLIMPAGPELNVFDATTGVRTNSIHIGGSFTYNNPTVVGRTVYIGNAWGWVTALPLVEVLGEDVGPGFPVAAANLREAVLSE